MPGSGASTGSLLPDLASLLRAVRKALLWYPRAFRTTRRSISTKHRGGVFYGFPPDAQGRNKVVEHTGGRPHPPAILARPLSPTRRDTHVGRYPIPPSWCRDFGQIGTLADCDTLGLSLHRTDRHPRRLRHPRFVTPPDRSTPSQTANPSCVRETRHFPGGIPHPPPILACSPSKLKLPRFRGQVSSSSSSRAARRS